MWPIPNNEEIFERRKLVLETEKIVENAIANRLTFFALRQILTQFLIEKGYHLPFPVLIRKNPLVNHYSPIENDGLQIQENDIFTVDIGALKNFPIDFRRTYFVNKTDPLKAEYSLCVKARRETRKKIVPNMSVMEIRENLENILKASQTFTPSTLLLGHDFGTKTFHGDVLIPCSTKYKYKSVLKPGFFTLEPILDKQLNTSPNNSNIFFVKIDNTNPLFGKNFIPRFTYFFNPDQFTPEKKKIFELGVKLQIIQQIQPNISQYPFFFYEDTYYLPQKGKVITITREDS
jgi:methionine aminopeptidase